MEFFVVYENSQIQLIRETDNGVVCSCWWYVPLWKTTILIAILNKQLPSTISILKGVEIESEQVVEKMTFHLSTEHVNL